MDPTLAQAAAPRAKAAGASLAGRPIGEILVAQGAVPQEKVAEALAAQAERGGRLGEVLISLKACSEEQVLKALAAQLELPYQMRLAPEEISPELVKLVPINFAKQARLMPLRIEVDGDARALVAIADPLDSSALDSVRLLLGASISPVLVPSQAILDCINSVYDRASNEAEQLVGDLEAGDLDMVAHELEEPQDLLDSSDEAPIIRLVNSLLFRAAKERASDIHIEPQEKDICVRFRGRRAAGGDPPAQALPELHHLAREDHGRPQYRREAAAAGRTHPGEARRPRHRHPPLHPPHGVRRARGDAPPRQEHRAARPGGDRHGQGAAPDHGVPHPHVSRYHPGHRSPRLRQDHHSLRGAEQDQPARSQHHDHRGPGRVPAQGNLADGGQPKDRADLRQRAAQLPPPGPGRDHGRRDPRPGDGGDRHPGVAHRPPGLLHGAHQRRRRRGHPPGGHGRGAVPGRLLADGSAGAAPGPRPLQGLPDALSPHPGGAEGDRAHGRRGARGERRHALQAGRLRAVQPDRVPRPLRNLRDDADGRRSPRAHPQERGQRDHQADGGQQGHAHADGRRCAHGRARDHQRRRGPQRHAGRRGLMPVFEYTGLTEAGKNVRGIRDAESSKVLRQILRKDGVYLTDARAAEAGAVAGEEKTGLGREVDVGAMLGFTGVSSQDVAIATRQLATLIAAGIPLVEALTALVDQVEQPRLKRVMGAVKQKVNEGSSLADALGEHPKVFSALYVNMIRAGESSGALDVVLVRLADLTESQAQLRNKIIGAMLYPAIMVVVGIGIVSILFVVVIPKVTKIFEDMNVALPWTTRILIAVSSFARDYWYLVLALLPAAVFGT